MATRFFTTNDPPSLIEKFKGIFKHDPDMECFDAMAGTVRASSYYALRPYLPKVRRIRLLVGVAAATDPATAVAEVVAELRRDLQTVAYRREVETGCAQFVDDVLANRIELRVHPTKHLATTLYIFRPWGFNERKPGAVITGVASLNADRPAASEFGFNVHLYHFDDVRFATDEFERLWGEAVPVPPALVQAARDATYLGVAATPQEIYWKLLAEYFGASIADDTTGIPAEYHRFSYQVDAINTGCWLLEKHHGFLLADVVGLGKTEVATLIAIKFALRHGGRTLIVTPPALAENWQWTAQKLGLDDVQIVPGGGLSKLPDPAQYRLVIVDEAYRFRGATSGELQRICQPPQKFILISAPADLAPFQKPQLIPEVTLRRTRADWKAIESYKKELDDQRAGLPKIKLPRAIYYRLDPALEDLYDRTVAWLTGPGPVRAALIKRLDSSVPAFREALRRVRDATGSVAESELAAYLVEGREDELLGVVRWEGDHAALVALCREWDVVTVVPKFAEFMACLKTELFSTLNQSGKLIVFSEFKETTDYLRDQLAQAGYTRVLTVDSQTPPDRLPVVRANFDASVPVREQANDYDILITTETLAERVNLHRANVLVNFDTPWTLARYTQRIARICRLGGSAAKIYIYNCYPISRVANESELKAKAVAKLRALHAALGSESQVYSATDAVDSFGLLDRTAEDDQRDDLLRLFIEIRQFRQQNSDGFQRIQNLPARVRVGRADSGRAGSTVVFLRDDNHDGLYRLTADGAVEEITLLEAAGDLRVPEAKERSLALPNVHHQHIRAALSRFGATGDSVRIVLSESFDQPLKL